MEIIKNFKSKQSLIIIGVSVSLFVFLLILCITTSSKIGSLQASIKDVNNQISDIQSQIDAKNDSDSLQKTQTIIEATGLDPRLVEKDSETAVVFFEDAFTWTSGAEYDAVRQSYIDKLGAGNSFTTNYLAPDVKIDTNDGPLSYIDNSSLKSFYDSMVVVPLTAEGSRIRYAGFVKYYMVKDKKDLANKNALTASEAIIKFTISGDGDVRTVSEVEAWPGFNTSIAK